MKEVTRTYYVCQYCGHTDSDASNMRMHESVCKGKIDISELVGKWVEFDDSSFFKIEELKPLFGMASGLLLWKDGIKRTSYEFTTLLNKSVDKNNRHTKFWEELIKAVEK